MKTDHVVEELLGYLEGSLSSADHARVGEHLSWCVDCRAEFTALAETYRELDRALKTAAAHADAPPDAWARFEPRLPHQYDGRNHSMNNNSHVSRRLAFPKLLLAGVAAVTLIIGALAGHLLLFTRSPQVVAVTPVTSLPVTSPAALAGTTPTAAQAGVTPRPQSGGGSGQPEGSSGENLAPTWQGTVRSVDPAARTITLDPDGRVIRVMDFTEFIVEDITWDGARGLFEDIRPGIAIQADLFVDRPPFARIIWVKRTQPGFWEDGSHELHSGVITSLDPSTGVFSVEPLDSGQFRITGESRILIDTDALDGQPATSADVHMGQMVNFVNPVGDTQPRPVALLMIVPPNPEISWGWFWATVTGVDSTSITVRTTESTDPVTLDLGPAGYAGSQGVSFAGGDLIAFRGYRDGAQIVPVEIIKLSGGEWLRLRDSNGPLWPAP